MKIKNIAIIILMTTFFIIIGTESLATTGKINTETVKLRKQPDSKTVLDLLDEGDEVEILEQENGWYKVKATTELGKVTGYVSEEFLDVENGIQETVNKETTVEKEEKVEQPVEKQPEISSTDTSIEPISTQSKIEEESKYTIEQEVSVKVLPLINSIEKAKITGNVQVTEIINDWAKIENDIQCGWVRTNTLKKLLTTVEVSTQEVSQEPEEEIQEQPIQDKTEDTETINKEPEKIEEIQETETTLTKVGYVDAEGLIIRKEPNTSSEEIHSLSRNTKVDIIGQEGNWYKINWGGEIGYVSAKYISDTKIPETTSRSGSTLKKEESTTQNETDKEEEKIIEEIPEETSKPTVSTTGTAVVEYAKQYLGYKYVSGGASPSTGFDCSGFTTYVYKHFGISLNRSSKDQIKNGVAVEKSDLQPGDLVLFNNDANTRIGHVGIYVGNGNFIHASNPKGGVKITTLTSGYYQKRYVGARRVI